MTPFSTVVLPNTLRNSWCKASKTNSPSTTDYRPCATAKTAPTHPRNEPPRARPSCILREVVLIILFLMTTVHTVAQSPTSDWQQRASYEMHLRLDTDTHQFGGTQQLVYYNNSPDTLRKIYYHLYFNAFQPGSMMDVRSRTIADPDARVRDRIAHLTPEEYGYQRIHQLQQNGQDVTWEVHETVLVVQLHSPLTPGDVAVMDMVFEGQVPLQIRRSGRDSREGIAYSMAQWYPRIAAYDRQGWATSAYVAREFHGTFADFDVYITLDSTYTIGGTGYLKNASAIGKGYAEVEPTARAANLRGSELTWHFHAPNVIDFMWGADDRYSHEIHHASDGTRIHLLYVDRAQTQQWKVLGEYTARAIDFLNAYLGEYPYEQFTVIQGGDGGMEYPMATLITGHRNLQSLVGVTVHELVHMWFQSVLATNESRYHWMDEGFTVYMSNITMAHLFRRTNPLLHIGDYNSYLSVVNAGLEEPMITHADLFETNRAYGMASYRKGSIFLHQLGYVIGEKALHRTLRRYYADYQFRHPTPDDLRRIAEHESGLILDWYFDQMINTTHTIDYALERVRHRDGTLQIDLRRKTRATMPLDLYITYADGSSEVIYIPEQRMLGSKSHESEWYDGIARTELAPWRWVEDTYTISLPRNNSPIARIVVDPTFRLADVNRLNNTWPMPRHADFMESPTPRWDSYGIGYRPALWFAQEHGLLGGVSARGSYLFGEHRVEAALLLATGALGGGGTTKPDADYLLRYTTRAPQFGRGAALEVLFKRYYGIGEESVTFTKSLMPRNGLFAGDRAFRMRMFHQYVGEARNINALQSAWDRGYNLGLELGYDLGEPGESGISWQVMSVSTSRALSASHLTLTADHTVSWGVNIRTRFSASVGSGSRNMPTQYRFTVSDPSSEQLWNNPTYWGIANLSDRLGDELNLRPNDGGGLLGYTLNAIGSPEIAANNYFAGTIWNTWQPLAAHQTLRHVELELFSGIGKTWNGAFAGDFPAMGTSDPVLASLGVGMVYHVNQLPALSRWRAQSRLVENLSVSVRMPFYMNGLTNDNAFGARFVIGVSESF